MRQSFLTFSRKGIMMIILLWVLWVAWCYVMICRFSVSNDRSFALQEGIDATVAIIWSQSDDVSSTLLSRASGVLVSPDGLILTTKHSVSDDGDYTVFTHQGDQYTVSQIWRDPDHDLAVLQVRDTDDLKPRRLPFLFFAEWEVTTGIVHALWYAINMKDIVLLTGMIEWYHDSLYQMRLSLLPGMSGGPVLTQDGKLIAINRAFNLYNPMRSFGIAVTKEVVQWFLDKNMTL